MMSVCVKLMLPGASKRPYSKTKYLLLEITIGTCMQPSYSTKYGINQHTEIRILGIYRSRPCISSRACCEFSDGSDPPKSATHSIMLLLYSLREAMFKTARMLPSPRNVILSLLLRLDNPARALTAVPLIVHASVSADECLH